MQVVADGLCSIRDTVASSISPGVPTFPFCPWELVESAKIAYCGNGENQNEVEEPHQTPTTALTAKASKGDVEIEVTDPDRYPIGKYIVIQESLIYPVEGKGSLILERPLYRDFLAEPRSVH